MDVLRDVAFVSIGRACGFAGLAIVCVMVGLSHDPVAAAKGGGMLTMILTLALLLKARLAPTRDVRHTELWIMLDKGQRPPRSCAQWVVSTVLRDAYLYFARFTVCVSMALWATALALPLAGL